MIVAMIGTTTSSTNVRDLPTAARQAAPSAIKVAETPAPVEPARRVPEAVEREVPREVLFREFLAAADTGQRRAVALWGSSEDATALASHPELEAQVIRDLVSRADRGALRALAANPSVRLPKEASDALVEASPDDPAMARSLAARSDVDVLGLRKASLAAEGAYPGPSRPVRPADDAEGAAGRVAVLEAARPAKPSDIALALSMGRVTDALMIVAKLANVPNPSVVRAVKEGDVQFAMQQMRAIGVDERTARWLLFANGRSVYAPGKQADAGKAYASTASTVSKAERGEPDAGSGVDMSI